MEAGQSSQTAHFVTILRANHFLFAPAPKLLKDSLAFEMSGLENHDAVKHYITAIEGSFAAMSDPETAHTFVKRIEHSVCIRSRLVEERLRVLRNQGLKQVVFLGAGMDTTAYRAQNLLEGLDVFEVDHPDTQAHKKQQLKSNNINIPSNLTFVGFDFENQTLAQALKAGGVDDKAVTLFPWLGVNMYLTDTAVRTTLSVTGAFPKGSEIIMDFAPPDDAHGDTMMEDPVDQLSKIVSQMGEPFLSQFTEAELSERLKAGGFETINLYSTERIVAEVLDGDRDQYCIPDDAVFLASAIT